jgi:phage-related protein
LTLTAPPAVISSLVSQWTLELEPEVQAWLEGLSAAEFAAAAFQLDRLAEMGAALRMPHSRALGDGLFELRFDLGRVAQRVSFFFPGERRVVLLTVFRKQRSNERSEIERARAAMRRCIEQGHMAEE